MGMIKLCLCSLKSKKGRTALIAISIAIGILSVMMIDIISDNGVVLINNELDLLGVCGVSVSKNSSDRVEMMTNEEFEQIKNQSFVKSATPVITASGYFKKDGVGGAAVCGIDENAKSVISVETYKGKKIDKSDIIAKSFVCLIDEKTAENLFESSSVIGKDLDIFLFGKTVRFKVKGVVKASSSILKTSVSELLPNLVYVPYTTLQFLMGNNMLDQVAVNFSEEYSSEQCVIRLKNVLQNNQTGTAEIEIGDLNKQRKSLSGILDIITAVLQLIGGVSLIVSGMGIMTVMLITVKEKTKEIGIKKSIGATKSKIVFEFLFESAFISAVGCGVGVLITIIFSFIIKNYFYPAYTVNYISIFYTVLIGIFCGIAFGVYPAFKAAGLKPIDALKNE